MPYVNGRFVGDSKSSVVRAPRGTRLMVTNPVGTVYGMIQSGTIVMSCGESRLGEVTVSVTADQFTTDKTLSPTIYYSVGISKDHLQIAK